MNRSTPEQLRFQGHLSHRALEELAFSEAGAAGDAHLATCEACGARVSALRRERDAFLATHPPAEMIAKSRRDPVRWHRLGLLLAPVALATVLMVFVSGALPARDRAVTAKGAAPLHLTVLRSRGGAPAEAVTMDARFRPGDVLRFLIRAPEEGYALVANIDDLGRFTRYYPSDRPVSAHVPPGEQVLPGAIELDLSPEDERIFLLLSPSPIEELSARKLLFKLWSARTTDSEALDPPGGARVTSVRVRREPR
jgi:hypothetical protein